MHPVPAVTCQFRKRLIQMVFARQHRVIGCMGAYRGPKLAILGRWIPASMTGMTAFYRISALVYNDERRPWER